MDFLRAKVGGGRQQGLCRRRGPRSEDDLAGERSTRRHLCGLPPALRGGISFRKVRRDDRRQIPLIRAQAGIQQLGPRLRGDERRSFDLKAPLSLTPPPPPRRWVETP